MTTPFSGEIRRLIDLDRGLVSQIPPEAQAKSAIVRSIASAPLLSVSGADGRRATQRAVDRSKRFSLAVSGGRFRRSRFPEESQRKHRGGVNRKFVRARELAVDDFGTSDAASVSYREELERVGQSSPNRAKCVELWHPEAYPWSIDDRWINVSVAWRDMTVALWEDLQADRSDSKFAHFVDLQARRAELFASIGLMGTGIQMSDPYLSWFVGWLNYGADKVGDGASTIPHPDETIGLFFEDPIAGVGGDTSKPDWSLG